MHWSTAIAKPSLDVCCFVVVQVHEFFQSSVCTVLAVVAFVWLFWVVMCGKLRLQYQRSSDCLGEKTTPLPLSDWSVSAGVQVLLVSRDQVASKGTLEARNH